MTTEPEAHAFLTDLTRLAQALDDAVLDSGLPAASGENAGIARSLPKSKSPCSDSLGDMRRDALAYVQQWAGNLSSDLTIRQPDTEKTGPTLTPWVHWLHRHRVDLIARPWWPDAEEELRDKVHRPLADQFTPPDPNRPLLPDFATAEELAAVIGKTVANTHRWCTRHHVESFTIGGVKHYKTTEVI
ncbi:hypothetical protein [Corynebacterium variabile]|uniref:hypothetical protein n=1 Tax=Corynebacterium variabile TaxID=1727 RepID=UPI003A94CCC2